jgi:hypothetical protein
VHDLPLGYYLSSLTTEVTKKSHDIGDTLD